MLRLVTNGQRLLKGCLEELRTRSKTTGMQPREGNIPEESVDPSTLEALFCKSISRAWTWTRTPQEIIGEKLLLTMLVPWIWKPAQAKPLHQLCPRQLFSFVALSAWHQVLISMWSLIFSLVRICLKKDAVSILF